MTLMAQMVIAASASIGSSRVMTAFATLFVNFSVWVTVAFPSLTEMTIVCCPFRSFWKYSPVTAKLLLVPRVAVKVRFVAPSIFSVTVRVSAVSTSFTE